MGRKNSAESFDLSTRVVVCRLIATQKGTRRQLPSNVTYRNACECGAELTGKWATRTVRGNEAVKTSTIAPTEFFLLVLGSTKALKPNGFIR
jgi:hypothetical protein